MPPPTVRLVTITCDREPVPMGARSAEDRLAAQSLADRARAGGPASASRSSEPDEFRSRRVTIRKRFGRGTRWPRLERIELPQMGGSATQKAWLPVLHSELRWAEGRTTSRSGRVAPLAKGVLRLEECGRRTRGQ